ITGGDLLTVHEHRSRTTLADARAIVFKIHNDGVVAGRELVLGGDGSPLNTDKVVVERWLACQEVEPPAVEASALGGYHAFRAAFRNLDVSHDFIRFVFQVRCAPFGDADLAGIKGE